MIFSSHLYQQLNHVGISFTPNAVRLVDLDSSGKVRLQVEEISPTPFIVGDTVDHPVLTKLLSKLIEENQHGQVYAAICFPEKLAYTREHTLPNLPVNELDEAIRWQLGDIFPIDPHDSYYDWKRVSQTDQATKVVVTAVPRLLLDSIRAACQGAGIKPISFESSAAALARAFTSPPGKLIITEIDSFGSSTTLVEQGVSTITSTTVFSATADSTAVIQDMVLSLKQLATRLEPSPVSVDGNTPASPTPSIYITGEKSSPKLAEILTGQLNQPVVELTIESVPVNYHSAYIEALTKIEAPDSATTINLLPENLQQQYVAEAELIHAKKTTAIGAGITGAACLIALGVFLALIFLGNQTKSKLAAIALPPNPPEQINVAQYMTKAQKLVALQPAKKIPTTTMQEIVAIVAALPVKQFDYNPATKTITLSLSSVDRASLFNLKAELEATNKVQPIAIPLSALGSQTAESIILSIKLKD